MKTVKQPFRILLFLAIVFMLLASVLVGCRSSKVNRSEERATKDSSASSTTDSSGHNEETTVRLESVNNDRNRIIELTFGVDSTYHADYPAKPGDYLYEEIHP